MLIITCHMSLVQNTICHPPHMSEKHRTEQSSCLCSRDFVFVQDIVRLEPHTLDTHDFYQDGLQLNNFKNDAWPT
jgi:hypothetical protein